MPKNPTLDKYFNCKPPPAKKVKSKEEKLEVGHQYDHEKSQPAIHLRNKTPRSPRHMEQMDMRIEQDNQSDNDSESSMDSYHDSDLNHYMSESDQDLEQDMC